MPMSTPRKYKRSRFGVHWVARLTCSHVRWTLEGIAEARFLSLEGVYLPVLYYVILTTLTTAT